MESLINVRKLKEYIDSNNISEIELANMIGVNYTTVYRVFRGIRKPGAKFIVGLINSEISLDYKDIFDTT
ncbi:helix-turn-helix domain-containing protein [Wukongibacter sp. M2B1]|uniref:helix-turn-helix domain-containing protein n=1 Tax=Wukongibacter sp. M2B1 TaxID=3088895 RepID=UPI003D7AF48F